MGRPRKGPTVKRQYACPACGHSQTGKSHFHDRPVAYRQVEFGGRGHIRVVKTVYADELGEHELMDQLRLVVARLADRFGVTSPEVVHEVVREVVRHRIPELFKRRAAAWQKDAEKWARHKANKGKRRGREFTVRGRRVSDAGNVLASWDTDEYRTRHRRRVIDEGNRMEQW